jgi:hypothetical protein
VTAADAGSVIVTGSHGGLVGGLPSRALKVPAAAAVFNDAGGGIDGAGYTRLPALDARGVAAATVASSSARIGDGLSSYEDGVLSAVNKTAASVGATVGMTSRSFVEFMLARPVSGAGASRVGLGGPERGPGRWRAERGKGR